MKSETTALVEEACKAPTLVDALVYVAMHVGKNALRNPVFLSEANFSWLFMRVLFEYDKGEPLSEKDIEVIERRMGFLTFGSLRDTLAPEYAIVRVPK
jgi:hypothetical protein